MKIIVEGWRSLPHSYSVINQFQCLELLQRPEINLRHRDVPYYAEHWQPILGLFDPAIEATLQAIPAPAPGESADALLRMGYPHDFSPADCPIFVFGTTELGVIKQEAIAGDLPLSEVHRNSGATLITLSEWAKQGFIRSGAISDRTFVVPAGVDPNLYHPLNPEARQALRQQLGWDGFVILNVGGMGGNKGIAMLLAAVAVLAESFPQLRLVLKGMDALYPSQQLLNNCTQSLTPKDIQRLQSRLHYLGQPMSYQEMAQLYQAADAYVSPYFAEGFNLPVLEAIASGLPVVCTGGGSTDDFTQPDFALRINSQIQTVPVEAGKMGMALLPDFEHLVSAIAYVITQPDFTAQARQAGPAFVQRGFTWRHTVDRLLAVMAGS